RQSSPMPAERNRMSPNSGSCMQRGPKRVAWRTPLQAGAGCGGFQRSAPIGGAAYGTPWNSSSAMPFAFASLPSILPSASDTRGGGSGAAAYAAKAARPITPARTLASRRAFRGAGDAVGSNIVAAREYLTCSLGAGLVDVIPGRSASDLVRAAHIHRNRLGAIGLHGDRGGGTARAGLLRRRRAGGQHCPHHQHADAGAGNEKHGQKDGFEFHDAFSD